MDPIILTIIIVILAFCLVKFVFKASVGILKLTLGLVGALLLIVLIPVGAALIIPVAVIALFIGLLKMIF